ncbi:MAG TPA: HEPN domain-containing protein [Firmicutes bacterium]|nr:HEPN domain-containing protein [Bacillota bacterium]
MNRYQDWLNEAQADLRHARHSLEQGEYNWACFAAQQAAEKAVKAVHFRVGQVAWGHSVRALLEELPEDVQPAADLIDKAKILDKHYIPARYPDAHPAGPAFRNYAEAEARQAVDLAQEVLDYCVSACLAARPSGGSGPA